MEISSVHHQQAMSTAHRLDEALSCPQPHNHQHHQDPAAGSNPKKPRPQPDQALKCPRCDSTNTKFCYYNNYSLTQPRYFCKGCRRYWTKGGSLRNVPVGGGCRKNKRPSSSSKKPSDHLTTTTTNNNNIHHDHQHPLGLPILPFPPLSFDPGDLSLTFNNPDAFLLGNPNPSSTNPSCSTTASFLDILKGSSDVPFQSLYYGDHHHVHANAGDGAALMFGTNYEEEQGGENKGAVTGLGMQQYPQWGASDNNSDQNQNQNNNNNNNDDNNDNNNNGINNNGVHGISLGMGMDHHTHHHYWNGAAAAASSWHGLINSSLL